MVCWVALLAEGVAQDTAGMHPSWRGNKEKPATYKEWGPNSFLLAMEPEGQEPGGHENYLWRANKESPNKVETAFWVLAFLGVSRHI